MKKGFTLVELIIVVTIVMLLGTIAVGMYFNSTKNLTYFSTFKSIQSTFRQARSFAITNASLQEISPERFGVYLEETVEAYHIFMFADSGIPFQYEKGSDIVYLTKDFYIPKADFALSVKNGSEEALNLPMVFFYEKNSGDFSAFDTLAPALAPENAIPKSAQNYIDIYIEDIAKNTLYRHLIINQVSGLSEEYIKL